MSLGLIPLAPEPGFDENVMTWEEEKVLVILSENSSKFKILKCFSHYAEARQAVWAALRGLQRAAEAAGRRHGQLQPS